jgi:hypothetical protein
MRRSACLILAVVRLVPPLASFTAAEARAAEPASADSESTTAQSSVPKVAEAERLAALAFDAYGRNDYAGALALYRQALGAARSADILYNIARVYDVGLHDGPHAIEYYRLYLAEPKALPPRSEFATRRISELQRPESEPAVAALPEGNSSAEPAPNDAAAQQPLTTAPASSWGWRETTAVALASGGVIALGAGIGFGLSAYAKSDEWQSECDGNVCRSQAGVDAAHTAEQRAHVATVALAAGGGLLAGAAAVWWLGSDRDEQASHVALQLAPAGGGAEVGCSLSGSF